MRRGVFLESAESGAARAAGADATPGAEGSRLTSGGAGLSARIPAAQPQSSSSSRKAR